VCFITADIKLPQKCSLRVEWYQAIRTAWEVNTLGKVQIKQYYREGIVALYCCQ
jgi:hypothetical protein